MGYFFLLFRAVNRKATSSQAFFVSYFLSVLFSERQPVFSKRVNLT